MKKRNETIRMLVLSAMFAALCCVTTMLVQFPTVAGYTNIGEAALLLQPMLKKGEKIPFWRLALIELPSEVIMVAGYFGYKALILGKGLAAAASIPNNLVQAAVGIVLSVVLYTALAKVPEIHKAFWKGE